jgi:hypothetical protein
VEGKQKSDPKNIAEKFIQIPNTDENGCVGGEKVNAELFLHRARNIIAAS